MCHCPEFGRKLAAAAPKIAAAVPVLGENRDFDLVLYFLNPKHINRPFRGFLGTFWLPLERNKVKNLGMKTEGNSEDRLAHLDLFLLFFLLFYHN